jgi:hypothetical protein
MIVPWGVGSWAYIYWMIYMTNHCAYYNSLTQVHVITTDFTLKHVYFNFRTPLKNPGKPLKNVSKQNTVENSWNFVIIPGNPGKHE